MNLLHMSRMLRRGSGTLVAVFIILAAVGRSTSAQVGKLDHGPVIRVTDVSTLATSYNGPADAVQSLLAGQVQPLSMVSSDCDEDGVADLIVGHAAPGGGFVTWHRGNLEAFAPQTEQNFKAMASGNFQDPVLPGASTFQTTVRPDFLAAGDFYQSGHIGLVVAAQGGDTINVLAGNGRGRFASPQIVTLPGTVTALAAGTIGNIGQPVSVLIGVQGPKQPLLLLYRGSQAGLVFAASYPLPAPATAFAFGDLDGHLVPDAAAVLAGGQVLVLHSGGTQVPALKPVSLHFSVSAMALGSYLFDRNRRLQMALLSSDGAIHIMAPNGFNSSPWTADELKVLQQVRLRKLPSPFHPVSNNQGETWDEVEKFSGVAPFSPTNRVPLLLRTRSGGSGGDDLTVFNRDADQTVVLSHPYTQQGVPAFAPGQTKVRIGSTRTIVAAVPMRLNAAAISGVMAISKGK